MTEREIEVRTLPRTTAATRQVFGHLTLRTEPRHMRSVNFALNGWLHEIDATDGLLTLFLHHTSASLTIQENADPDVQADLITALDRIVPEGAGYRHETEGADDMPAHIKTVLTGVSLQIPVLDGQMDLGTWQAVYIMEHRDGSHKRTVTLHYLGG